MDAMAEAMAMAEGEEDMDKKIEAALACPCLGDLKEGPCGPSFVYAFGCFMRSEHEDKGMDCLAEFAAFQACLQKHPEHVARIMEEPPAEGAAAAAAAGSGGGGGDGSSAGGAGGAAAAESTPQQPQPQHAVTPQT
ncbi:coiled-coil-helix-coiled-coil-helix domain-containing 4 [Micractinium conductrix]|uniref:Coiled-coil-helix-coiled-coil-helix domain-containing 4 n=1 Tax=Micractinium conductrix TaxID=554055 RepID=A0A2P6VFP6_9CHLO|nr:coiled-coil-helix-coiled-coil-helix domain-containing 4 [Micractinium conductrix]|eukprot:PSC72916.1 coiled-coil-helix-coiled-coil-helix domain-containing 4 [Micractinium conductrix]